MSYEPPAPLARRLLLLALLALILYALAFQGVRGLWDSSEGRYTNVAVEMLRFGDWLHPITHHEHAHLTKPPLTYWALATSIQALGYSEWAARLPGVIAFVLTTLLLYLLGRLFVPQRPWLAPLIYASFFLPATASNVVTTDNLLTLAETAAMTGFAYAYWGRRGGFGARYGALLAWLAGGVGFLIKGPAVGLPLLALLVFHVLRRRQHRDARMYWASGPLLAAAIGTSWFLVLSDYKPAFLVDFIWHEVILRATTGEHHRNSGWYGGLAIYLPVLLLGTLPWTWTALRGVAGPLRAWWRSRRDGAVALDDRDRLLLLWLLLPLAVFLVARSRLPLYVLPLFAPLALLAARAVDGVLKRRYWYLLPVVGMVAVLGLRITAAYVDDPRDSRALAMELQRLVPGEMAEVVFVDADAQQGLTFYLDTEVEEVTLGATPLTEPPLQSVATELPEDEPSRVWLLPESRRPAFERWASDVGQLAVKLGEVTGLQRYEVFRLQPAQP
jgi:4-amino-4-deoxy-L-arabinose transferase